MYMASDVKKQVDAMEIQISELREQCENSKGTVQDCFGIVGGIMFIIVEKNNGVFNGFHYKNPGDKDVSVNFTPFEKSCSNLGSGEFILSGFRGMMDEQHMIKQCEMWKEDIFRISNVNLDLRVVPAQWLIDCWGIWRDCL